MYIYSIYIYIYMNGMELQLSEYSFFNIYFLVRHNTFILFIYFNVVLRIERKASRMLGKCCTAEPQPQPQQHVFFFFFFLIFLNIFFSFQWTFILFYLFICGAENRTQCLTHARQMLYHWAMTPSFSWFKKKKFSCRWTQYLHFIYFMWPRIEPSASHMLGNAFYHWATTSAAWLVF